MSVTATMATMPDTEKDVLGIYSDNCDNCSHLRPDKVGAKAFIKCHYDKGNKYCPASEVIIVVVGKAYRMAEQVRKARERRDASAEAVVMAQVAKCHTAIQSKFYDSLENGE